MPNDLNVTFAAILLLCCGAANATLDTEDRVTTQISASLGEFTTITQQVKPFRPLSNLQKQLPNLPGPNASIVKCLLEYPRTGVHTYWWPKRGEGQYDGATTDVIVAGIPAMKGEAKGRTFCCGLTLEVLLRTIDKDPAIAGAITSETLPLFKRLWFCDQLFSPGPEDALLGFGLGKKIENLDAALPGDFVQIWRNNRSGHSVIFVAWAYDPQGHRVGLHYWSTQPGTKGINFNSELFGDREATIDEKKLSISRLLPSSEWRQVPADAVRERFGQ
ncbi:MAG: hypothetical protein ACR2IE_19125 [Candidatus Sumerlaeaceae bacterium]